MSTSHLQNIFAQAYILGGSPCSGKSTVAEMLSAQYSFHYYKADDHESEHMQRSQPDRQPVMFRYSKMKWDEIWSQSPERLLADELTYYHERFPFVLDDLKHLSLDRSAILEGAAFLPDLIQEYIVTCEKIVFMIPTPEFQLKYYSQRPWIQSILNECHNPEQAFEHWMKRDALFGEEVIRQANAYGFRVILVDGSIDIQRQFAAIRARFKL